MSTAVSGSVHSITSKSPLLRALSALRVRKAGRGHFKPWRFIIFSAMAEGQLLVAAVLRQYSAERWPVNLKINASGA